MASKSSGSFGRAAVITAAALSAAFCADDAAAWMALGVSHAARGDYQRAEEPFHRACLLNPKLPDACLYYGRTLYLLDRFDQAVNVLRTALQTDPENAQLFRILALALEAQRKTDDAEAAFRQAIRFNRNSAPNEDPAIDYGVFLYREGRTEAAIDPLQSAVKRHPDAARAHLELGCALLELDRIPQAIVHLQRADALDPNSQRARLLLAKAQQRQK